MARWSATSAVGRLPAVCPRETAAWLLRRCRVFGDRRPRAPPAATCPSCRSTPAPAEVGRQPKRRGAVVTIDRVPLGGQLTAQPPRAPCFVRRLGVNRFGANAARARKQPPQHRAKIPPRILRDKFFYAVRRGSAAGSRAFLGKPDVGPAMPAMPRSMGAGNVPQESTAVPGIRPNGLNTICYVLARRQCLSCGH